MIPVFAANRSAGTVRSMALRTGYDPFSPDVIANPYPWYDWLRTDEPCRHVQERDIYVISRYDDVVAAARNHEVFSSTEGVSYDRRPTPMMIAMDPDRKSVV